MLRNNKKKKFDEMLLDRRLKDFDEMYEDEKDIKKASVFMGVIVAGVTLMFLIKHLWKFIEDTNWEEALIVMIFGRIFWSIINDMRLSDRFKHSKSLYKDASDYRLLDNNGPSNDEIDDKFRSKILELRKQENKFCVMI